MVAAFDIRSARLTFFEPNGNLVSSTRMPPNFFLTDLHGNRAFGMYLALLDRTRPQDQASYFPMEVDAFSGTILWEQPGFANMVGRDCFGGLMGILNPEGGLVTTACEHELVFLGHMDGAHVTVVRAPNYFPTLPNARDVDAYVAGAARIGGGALPATQREAYAVEYREKPKAWFLGGPLSLTFDGENRLWAATTVDRDAFSYIEVWIGTAHAGTVRIRDRLMGYDILGSTLVALVERKPDRYGVAQRAIDWYDIGKVRFPRD